VTALIRNTPHAGSDDPDRIRRPDGRVHQVLGAHPETRNGTDGVHFSVWAPNATSVSVVGSFNGWDSSEGPMRLDERNGTWACFVPGVEAGALYKYHVVGAGRGSAMLKADPCGALMQLRPDTASVVAPESSHVWSDQAWMLDRGAGQAPDSPVSIYEVHVSSWRRAHGADPRAGEPGWPNYRELADDLIPYVKELGFTHLELLPITEHPLDRSWGYQTVGYFAPTSRHGDPDDFRYLVDRAHEAGLGVILDWVPAHFPRDAHGLARFDGTYLYEHADPRRGAHPDWGTLLFNYGRPEVTAFLISSALCWLEEFHIDGLRLDAVASMLYLDYSREEGAWVPNRHGGKEHLEAIDFLRILTDTLHRECPGVLLVAEESTAWPGVTHGTDRGGLGFDLKWNMGWMHDTLEVVQADPLFRAGVWDRLTFGITYAWSERYLLPFSHDEVVHLKRSMLGKMPGSTLDRFAGLRLLYGYQWTQPGKKLLFMGGEFAVWHEWDAEGVLDWPLLEEPMHAGVHRWVADLNALYRDDPALHALDCHPDGFEWIDCHDREHGVLTWIRWAPGWTAPVVVAANFSGRRWDDYRIGVPLAGRWEVVLASDDARYGGSGRGPVGGFDTFEGEHLGRAHSVEVTLPALSLVVLSLGRPASPAARD
jgi:1,4-alpha-glucan branching enzyme